MDDHKSYHVFFDTMSYISSSDSDEDIDSLILSSKNCKKPVYSFCCICGKTPDMHSLNRHKFILAIQEYKCKKCGEFYFKHTHEKKSCLFSPYKYI